MNVPVVGRGRYNEDMYNCRYIGIYVKKKEEEAKLFSKFLGKCHKEWEEDQEILLQFQRKKKGFGLVESYIFPSFWMEYKHTILGYLNTTVIILNDLQLPFFTFSLN